MIQLIKSLKFFLISVLLLLFMTSCMLEKKYIDWNIIGTFTDGTEIVLKFRNQKEKIRSVKVKVNKRKSLEFFKYEVLCGVEHDSNFYVTVNQDVNSNVVEIYLFPRRNLLDLSDAYLVEAAPFIDFYFIEGYDEDKGKNYYIFSRDNEIKKQSIINPRFENLALVLENLDSDCAYYTDGEQKLLAPYNGYIIKSKNFDNYVFLSTLWGEFSFIP